jgi:hypothetical protein
VKEDELGMQSKGKFTMHTMLVYNTFNHNPRPTNKDFKEEEKEKERELPPEHQPVDQVGRIFQLVQNINDMAVDVRVLPKTDGQTNSTN